ncbi:MAG: prepilin-type N-terminal cleavage/methylation domain-containing protein [Pyrinomonadaceae bacterium]
MQETIKPEEKTSRENGFSLVELLVVLVIIVIMTTVSLLYFTTTKQLYKPDIEGLQIVDMIQEARQRALTQRTTMRVELDLDSKLARLIDEHGSKDPSQHELRRTVSLYDPLEVRIDTKPNNVSGTPPETAPVPAAVFKPSTYVFSPAHNVCTLRFTLTGAVYDAGSDGLGNNDKPVSATIYVWKPQAGSATNSEVSRAITVVGSSGAVRMWEYALQGGSYIWKDSQRSGYGS